jgi:hypothetical protein
MLKQVAFGLAIFSNFITLWQSALAQSSGPAPQLWISASNAVYFYSNPSATPGIYTNGPDYGTRADVPLFGDFDTILAQITNQCPEIHLFPGVYYTSGFYGTHYNPIGSGFKIRGSGISATTLRNEFSPTNSTQQGIIVPNPSFCNFIEISDLTADYGMPINSNVVVRYGILLNGTSCRVKNVKVTSIYGEDSAQTVGILVGTSATTNGFIEGCEISGTCGNSIVGMILIGNGAIHNNSVYLPPSASNPYLFGYEFEEGQTMTITQNYLTGGYYGIVGTEGTSCSNIVMADNVFDNVEIAYWNPLYTAGQNWKDVYFTDNVIHSASGDGVWVAPDTGATFTNLVVARNIFIPWDATSTNIGLPVNVWGSIYNVKIFGNAWPSNSLVFQPGYDNVDLSGEIFDAPTNADYVFNQANAVGALPSLICSSSNWPAGNQLSIWNTYVIVTSTPPSPQLILPLLTLNSGYRPGRQVIIANTATNAPVTIVPQSGSGQILKVNGIAVSSLTLYDTNPPVRFISDNYNTWSQY